MNLSNYLIKNNIKDFVKNILIISKNFNNLFQLINLQIPQIIIMKLLYNKKNYQLIKEFKSHLKNMKYLFNNLILIKSLNE
jgi:hypothetical protein